MRRSLLALFRGPDGRSLAIALAVLIVLNLFAAGMQGVAAVTTPGGVLCSVEDADGKAPVPTGPGHAEPCCLAGCVASAVALAGGNAAPLSPPSLISLFVLPPAASADLAQPRPIDHGPRGPPSLA